MFKAILGGLVGAFLFANMAEAACPVTNTFVNGNTADALQVNTNFSDLTGCVAPLSNPSFTTAVTVTSNSSNRPLLITDGRSTTYSSSNYNGISSILLGTASNSIGIMFGPTAPTGPGTVAAIGAVATASGSYKTSLVFMTRDNAGNDLTRMTLSDAGDLTVAGCVNYNASHIGTCLSDFRVKKNIKSFTLGLNDIAGLRPVTYQYNGLADTSDDGSVRTGLIAQEVQKISPNLTATTKRMLHPTDESETPLLEVKYGDLTFALINAVKELKAANDNQSAEIARLEAKVGKLQHQIDAKTAVR